MQMPNTTPTFRDLCAGLIEALDSGIPSARLRISPLAERARAALAAEPQGPLTLKQRAMRELDAWEAERNGGLSDDPYSCICNGLSVGLIRRALEAQP